MPKGKGKKSATTCVHSKKPAVRQNVISLGDIFRENMAGAEQFLWSETMIIRWLNQLWIQDGATARTTAGVIIAWIYISQFSSAGLKLSAGNLQITNLDLLRGGDCQKLCRFTPEFSNTQVSVRGINATKVFDVDKQVCLIVSVFHQKEDNRLPHIIPIISNS